MMPKQSAYEVSMKKDSSITTACVKVKGELEVVDHASILERMGMLKKSADLPQELRMLCGRLDN